MHDYVKRITKMIPKLSQEQLQRIIKNVANENAMLDSILESLTTGLIVVDKQWRILKFNKISERFLSYCRGGTTELSLIIEPYDASYKDIENITHAECWAHCRRYFYESIPLDESNKMNTTCDGYIGIQYCDKLFKIEKEIANLSVEEKTIARQEKSKPILEEFYKWVKSTMSEKIIINKKLSKALTYASNQEKELSEFLNDGRIPLTNSLAERAIRPFAVHRKNWLFADSTAGAKANAVMYSLVESAKLNNLNIEKYINYLLTELPQEENLQDEKVLSKYLPWSKELPEDILNFEGTYEEINFK